MLILFIECWFLNRTLKTKCMETQTDSVFQIYSNKQNIVLDTAWIIISQPFTSQKEKKKTKLSWLIGISIVHKS